MIELFLLQYLNSVDISTDEREDYLKYAGSLRRNESKKSDLKKIELML